MQSFGDMACSPFLICKIPLSLLFYAYELCPKTAIKQNLLYKLQHMLNLFLYIVLWFFRQLSINFPAVIREKNVAGILNRRGNTDLEVAGNILPIETTGDPVRDSSIARALAQILLIMNEMPVSSRKYDMIRGLAEKIVEENAKENCWIFPDINRRVLSASFSHTLLLLQERMHIQDIEEKRGTCEGSREVNQIIQKIPIIRSIRNCLATKSEGVAESGVSAEKLAKELLWLAERLAACGAADEAVSRWSKASTLARLALEGDLRLQASILNVTVFLLRKMREMEEGVMDEASMAKMLVGWMPLLCHASNGLDSPVLTSSQKREIEGVLEVLMEKLLDRDREAVLSLWLSQYARSSSDWPNLQAYYTHWCAVSRKLTTID
ncbi:uncharacterized protein LOC18442912 [Amborella trichopoda]|nr:uncharacterized protein LOC18442912 [Amborella trichopoda]|eukprot:XP_006853180.2 uncharacterized protein LOC18442912 [Amborella trichopoda]